MRRLFPPAVRRGRGPSERRPFVVSPDGLPIERPSTAPWLAWSVLLHLAAAVAAANDFLTRRDLDDDRPRADESQRAVELVYVPPPRQPAPKAPSPPEPEPTRPPEPRTPSEAPRQPPLPGLFTAPPPPSARPEERPNALPTETAQAGRADPADRAAPEDREAGDKGRAEVTAPRQPEVARAPTMEEEARRIFGKRRGEAGGARDPVAIRPFSSPYETASRQCTPLPPFPRDDQGRAPMGEAVGRILRQDNGRPLAGAHLQMVGTPFTAWTDENGGYRFRYDLSLIEDCRTQFVRVTAPGYESRMLVLIVGDEVHSEDVALRRR